MTTQPITHIVQAQCNEFWADCRKATSLDDARRQETELLANDGSWMPMHQGPDGAPRVTRIVPVEQSNCADRYNRPE